MSVTLGKSKERLLLEERLVKIGYTLNDFSNLGRNDLKKKVHELEAKTMRKTVAKTSPLDVDKEETERPRTRNQRKCQKSSRKRRKIGSLIAALLR